LGNSVFFQHLLPLVFQQKIGKLLDFCFLGLSSVLLTIFSNLSEKFAKFSISPIFYKKKTLVSRFDTNYIICKILKFAKNTFLKEQNFVRGK
jgi:hypothetical protein